MQQSFETQKIIVIFGDQNDTDGVAEGGVVTWQRGGRCRNGPCRVGRWRSGAEVNVTVEGSVLGDDSCCRGGRQVVSHWAVAR